MTQQTSQHLADVLKAAGFNELAARAELDEFHDFHSPHTFPEMELDKALVNIMNTSDSARERDEAYKIRMRHHDGEFDASLKESDEWAESADGQEAFNLLIKGEGQ